MAQADSAHTTTLSDLSSPARGVVQLFHTPAKVDLPPLDRRALMVHAHRIARQTRPYVASYREALAHGLRAAWGLIATRREFAAVRARVAPVTHTAKQIAASRRATRRCGASYMPF